MQYDHVTTPAPIPTKKRIFPSLAAWWAHFKDKSKDMSKCSGPVERLSLFTSPDVNSNISISTPATGRSAATSSSTCSASRTSDAVVMNNHLDEFTRTLDKEGLLMCRDCTSKHPVLTICYGFLDSELSVTSNKNEEKCKESFGHLDTEQQDSYLRLFSSQYPMEPLVDGLPGSVWLECVEPTLAILKTLNTLKHRKSNLSIRKCFMPIVDSNAACHGDFESAPLMVNPFINGHQLRLLRVHFLALEGVINTGPRNNSPQNSLHEVQEDRHSRQVPLRPHGAQRRRHLRMYRPYEVLHSLFRNADQLENMFEFGEIIDNNGGNGSFNATET